MDSGNFAAAVVDCGRMSRTGTHLLEALNDFLEGFDVLVR